MFFSQSRSRVIDPLLAETIKLEAFLAHATNQTLSELHTDLRGLGNPLLLLRFSVSVHLSLSQFF